MPAFIDKDGAAVEVFRGLPFVDRDEISRPSNWLELAAPEELAGAGIVEIAEPPAPPEGKIVVPGPLENRGGVPTRSFTLEDSPAPDLAAVKAARADAVTDLSAQHVAAGYVHDFGGATGPKTLQTRDEDKPNWLALMATAQALVIMDQGSAPCGEIRALDNTRVPVTAVQAQGVMLGMQATLSARMKHGWDLKDAIRDAPDVASVQAIDITAGWPA